MKILQYILDDARCDSWREFVVMTCVFVVVGITLCLWLVKLNFVSPQEAALAIVGSSMGRIVIGVFAMLTRTKKD
ncbi:hypothetical protein [Shewanella colwelliana]|uniref:hypothetical protein n=1 Tax=Shewanella colwelliana TaxID=23 RepID=UPI0022AE8999|nr:hypothetical protein [Shewanella colwelliana]MCZ4337668.1 hypothetical protein [Shewanella colwelliana]